MDLHRDPPSKMPEHPTPAPPTPAASGPTPWALLGLGAALLVQAALVFRFDFLIDDAFIAFRYAANWASGEGLRFNAGVEPPVEGFSDFLWVLLLALGERVDLDPGSLSRLLSIPCGFLATLLVHRTLHRRIGAGPLAATAGALAVATWAGHAVWSSSGLETMPFALASLVALLGLCGPRRSLAAGLGLGCAGLAVSWLRVEGSVVALGLIPLAALASPGEARSRARLFLGYALPIVLGMVALSAFRQVHFGTMIPNTVHAKAGLSTEVLMRGLKTTASYGLLAAVPCFALALAYPACRGDRGNRRSGHAEVRGALLFALAFCAYNIGVGGDWMPFFRFLVPAQLGFAIVLGAGLGRLRPGIAAPVAVLALGLGALPSFGWSPLPRGLAESLYFREFTVGYQTELARFETTVANGRRFERIGEALGEATEAGESMACGAIGAIGYHSGLWIHDRNGLVDREVSARPVRGGSGTAGHDKRVPWSFFAERQPDYYEATIFEFPSEQPLSAAGPAVAQFARRIFALDPALRNHCVPELRRLGPSPGREGSWVLLLLRGTGDQELARRSWDRRLVR